MRRVDVIGAGIVIGLTIGLCSLDSPNYRTKPKDQPYRTKRVDRTTTDNKEITLPRYRTPAWHRVTGRTFDNTYQTKPTPTAYRTIPRWQGYWTYPSNRVYRTNSTATIFVR